MLGTCKKWLYGLLAGVIVLLGIGMTNSVYASQNPNRMGIVEGDYMYYILDDGTIEIGSYYGNDVEVDVPTQIAGYDVSVIGDAAYAFLPDTTIINIPDCITKIGGNAFYECTSLEEITIPDGIKSIENNTFWGCTSLKKVNIPQSVTRIGEYAFYECKSLESISFPKNLKVIDQHAFDECWTLKEVSIPNGVTAIEDFAFAYCINLEKVSIPKTVTSIGSWAFGVCTKLTDVQLSSGITKIEDRTFSNCDYLEEITIPSSVKSMGDEVFFNCYGLKKVTIPSSVKSIGEDTFYGCDKLTIYGQTGSYAQTYAKTNKISFKAGSSNHTHKYTNKVTKRATVKRDGEIKYTCSCGDSYTKAIRKVETVKLSKTDYAYDGKVKNPSVIVKDSKGKALKKGTDYTIKRTSGCRELGEYTVKVVFKGKYSGNVTLTYRINPQSVKLSAVKAQKKGFKVTWKKGKEITGYEIQYSTTKKFTKKTTKTLTVKGIKTTSKSVKKLLPKQKYYVRIRTYKTVKVNGKSMKLYSDWSGMKQVTTKK